jgi:hypothetical protein
MTFLAAHVKAKRCLFSLPVVKNSGEANWRCVCVCVCVLDFFMPPLLEAKDWSHVKTFLPYRSAHKRRKSWIGVLVCWTLLKDHDDELIAIRIRNQYYVLRLYDAYNVWTNSTRYSFVPSFRMPNILRKFSPSRTHSRFDPIKSRTTTSTTSIPGRSDPSTGSKYLPSAKF